ncbi:MAG: TldD/PmbA family protein [Thermoproteota archaeon]
MVELHEKVLKMLMEKGAEEAIVILRTHERSSVRYANNEPTIALSEVINTVTIYSSIRERSFLGSFENVSEDFIEKIVDDVITMTKNSPPSPYYAPIPKGPFNYRIGKRVEGRIRRMDEQLISYVSEAVKASRESGAERSAGIIYADHQEERLVSSTGLDLQEESSSISLNHRAFASSEATGQWVSCSTTLRDFDPYDAGRRAGEIARKSLNPRFIEEGVYDVYMGPLIFANIMSEVAGFASGFLVQIEMSFLSGKLGEKVGADELTIIDDPTMPQGLGEKIFDEEGIPTQRTVIIENGVLKNYLHNSRTARVAGTSSTGNAGIIYPHPWNIIIKPGNVKEEDMLQKLGKGLFLTNSWYQRYQNYKTGDFSTIVRDGAFYVEDGEIKYPVKGCRISDNLQRIISNIELLSDRLYPIKWWEVEVPTYAPTAVIRNVKITRAFG